MPSRTGARSGARKGVRTGAPTGAPTAARTDAPTAARTGTREAAQGGARFARVHVVGDAGIGQEARATADDHGAVRLWLRLFSCSAEIEQEIRSRLRARFDITLPRFDYLAQLERHPGGLRLNALSRYLMVTGGNVTALTTQLIADGFVERLADPRDGRSTIVRLTPRGRRRFLRMAAEHEQWIVELLDGLDAPHRDALYSHLGRLRVHLASRRPAPPIRKERAS